MTFPSGVQTSTLTFSNPITFLGNPATRTEVTVQATAGVVWTATGQPIDDFPEVVAPGDGLPGSLTAPFVDQEGFTDQAGNDFTMWAYVVTRKTFYGSSTKTVKKAWAPIIGQSTIDFDNLPGGSVGLPVSAPPVPVTSVASLTGVVVAEDLAGELLEFIPSDVTPESVAANLPGYLEADAIADGLAPKLDASAAATTYAAKSVETSKLDVSTAATTYAAKSVETSKLDASQKGAASGVAPLDSGSRVAEANLPTNLAATALSATYVGLKQAAKNPDLLIAGTVTVDGSDLVTSAVVAWPDGTPGVLTITSRDANSAVLAYNITYGSPVTKTFTQPTITRNANGAATNVPQIVVS